MTKERLVIGIDYGTTYTGVAFCHSGGKRPSIQDIHLITDWPGLRLNATNEKVPSQIAYGSQFEDGFEWGNKIKPRTKREAWTKLLLDEREKGNELKLTLQLLTGNRDSVDIVDGRDDDTRPPPYPGKAPVEIIGDFLSGVKKQLESNLATRYGKAILSLFEMEVVITVPAVWSDKAKDLTCQALFKAGFDTEDIKVSMIAEPEAAAIYILRELRDGPFSNIVAGDNFVVCDAGGGTADLISYCVESINPTFKITEAAVGDKCGAVFVDRDFKVWLRQKLGDENFQKIRKEKLEAGSKLMTEFELAKAAFSGDNLQFYITVPEEVNDPTLGIIDREIIIDPDDMRKIFDPCVNRILELIDGQINEVASNGGKVKYVLLAGGFGMSDYLLKTIKDYCGKKGIEAIRPIHPWSAVVRGAVIQGLGTPSDNLVQVRLCRRHYGTSVLELFDKDKHRAEDMVVDLNTTKVYARGCMKWLLSKGDPLPIAAPKKGFIEVRDTFTKDEPRISHAVLLAWDGDNPPCRDAEGPYKVCDLRADLSEVPPEKFVRDEKGAAGDGIDIATFKIEVTVEGSVLDFRLLLGDTECGAVKAEYA